MKAKGNPQLENGYVKIANEILEALCSYRLSGEEMKCLLFIIRKTYGWDKKSDDISLSQFVQAVDIAKPNVCRALNKLSKKNVIIVIKKDNGKTTTYRFNKKYKTWKPLSKKITLSKKIMSVIQIDNKSLSKKRHTINNSTKNTITINKLHRSQKNSYHKKAKAVLRYLNRKKKSKYQDVSKIVARLKDGKTVKECLTVINNKFADEYFQENPRFLNPATLFRKSHWDKYINDIPDPLSGKVSSRTRQNINTLKEWGKDER